MRPKLFPNLYSNRLVLDEVREDDTDAIYDIFSNPKAMSLYDMERLTKPEEASDIVDFLRNKFTHNSGIRWAIREASAPGKSSPLIGTCGFNNWVAYDHSAIIGYELAPEFWGKGYATEAIHKIISAAYNDELQIHINRIEASVVPGNIGSEKVLKKNGFIFEGRLHEKAFWDDQYQDMNLFALIKSRFLKS
ncbi:MAG: ribosomal-protein-alanine N-acetyltransferase [Pseudohongiellaceae bacterium]|jgi:ribosomal-protein-alanine N-acetyltransferase